MVPLACLLLTVAGLAPRGGLRIVAVERQGLPPYEDADRSYRLEGEDVGLLRPGQRVRLSRPGEVRSPGRLRIISVESGSALAALDQRGALYPLRGDRAQLSRLEGFPGLPDLTSLPTPPPPRAPATANPVEPSPSPGEPIFFLKGSAALSPGAIQKLQAWVRERGPGTWTLGVTSPPETLSTLDLARLEALRLELRLAGVTDTALRQVQAPPSGKYEAVYVSRRP